MEGTHLPLNVWYRAMYLILSCSKEISALNLSSNSGCNSGQSGISATQSGPCCRA
jgi:hypothetical protein